MPGLQDIPGDQVFVNYIAGQATAGTDDSWPVFVAPGAVKITGLKFIPAAAASGANTNNNALQFINKGAANAGTAQVSTVKTYASGTDSAANTPESFTLSSTASDLNMAAGDVLVLVRTHNGSGLLQVDGAVQVSYQYR